MRSITRLAAIAVILGGATGATFAQDVDEEISAPSRGYYYYTESPPAYDQKGKGVYGYWSLDRPMPVRPDDCGVYHYWNGERCVDARVTPPDLSD